MTSVDSALNIASDRLTDQELLAHLRKAVQTERRATAEIIALLMELDLRRLYLGEGFSSLFTYCTRALHLGEHATYNRIEAARAARRFPVILGLIAQGAVTLTSIRLLAPHLTDGNHRDVLQQARHKSRREVEQLVARLHPRAAVPSVVRKLPTPPSPNVTARETVTGANDDHPASIGPSMQASLVLTSPAPRPADVKPIAPDRYRIQFTAGRDTHDKLRRAQDLLRHSVPNGDVARIFDRAITLLLAHLERQKNAATARPHQARRVNAASRHIPAEVRRIVWRRDGGRCAFDGAQGRCAETGFLEYHHVVPFAAGGEASADNIQLRCRAHNGYEAERAFLTSRPLLVREERLIYEDTSRSFRNELGSDVGC
jgi:5-methylcytosine-specific restriction endonuclease McrA